jgi:hypothetical protein
MPHATAVCVHVEYVILTLVLQLYYYRVDLVGTQYLDTAILNLVITKFSTATPV